MKRKLEKLEFLFFDLDGVVFHSEDYLNEFERRRSLLESAVDFAKNMKIHLGVVSGISDEILSDKLKKIGISEVCCESLDKISGAEKILAKYNLTFSQVGYIGNDILDIPLLSKTGFSAAPSTARREVKRIVNYVGKNNSQPILNEILQLIAAAKHIQINLE